MLLLWKQYINYRHHQSAPLDLIQPEHLFAIYLRSISILNLQVVPSHRDFGLEFWTYFSSVPCALHSLNTYHFCFITLCGKDSKSDESLRFSMYSFLQPADYFFALTYTYPVLKHFKFTSPQRVTGQVSYPSNIREGNCATVGYIFSFLLPTDNICLTSVVVILTPTPSPTPTPTSSGAERDICVEELLFRP
jgi:hypothetical protein